MADWYFYLNKQTDAWHLDTRVTILGCKALRHFGEWFAIWNPKCNGYNGLDEWMVSSMESRSLGCNGGQQFHCQSLGWNGGQQFDCQSLGWNGGQQFDCQSLGWNGGQQFDSIQPTLETTCSSSGQWNGSKIDELADKFQITGCSGEYHCNGVVAIWEEKQTKYVGKVVENNTTFDVTGTVVWQMLKEVACGVAYCNKGTKPLDWSGGQHSGLDARQPTLLEKTSSSDGDWNGNDIEEMVNILKNTDWWICGQNVVADSSKLLDWSGGELSGPDNTMTKKTLAGKPGGQPSEVNCHDWSAVAESTGGQPSEAAVAESTDTTLGQPSEANCLEKVASKLKKTAEELQGAGIDLRNEDIKNLHTMNLEEFDHLLINNNLSQEQIDKCKEIRRRGKNSVAANKSRKRKCSHIDELAEELEQKENEKRAVKDKNERLYAIKLKEDNRLNMLISKILTLSNRSHDHYTVKVMNNQAKVVRKNAVH